MDAARVWYDVAETFENEEETLHARCCCDGDVISPGDECEVSIAL